MEVTSSDSEPARDLSPHELPWVTVLLPVYNGEQYVTQAIESILAQSHRSFEFLIMDDGSTDDTPDILARYAARDSRIRVVRHANIGQPATLNKGLSLARYDWVAIMDHDDISLPLRLEKELEMIRRVPEARLIGTWAREINAQGIEIGLRCTGPTTAAEFQAIDAGNLRVPLTHPSVMMHRKTVLDLGGYDAAFGPSADTELWTRVARKSAIVVVPEVLHLYRIHGHSMSFREMFEQREMLRWILDRDQSRRNERPVKTLDEFRSTRRPWHLLRWREGRQDLFWFFRSYCLLAVAEQKRGRAMLLALCAACVAPTNALCLIKRQLLSIFDKKRKSRKPDVNKTVSTCPTDGSPR